MNDNQSIVSEYNYQPIMNSYNQQYNTQQYDDQIDMNTPMYSLEQVVGDILEENKRLRRDIETLRIQNTSLRREHEELIHALLADRLRIQNPELEF